MSKSMPHKWCTVLELLSNAITKENEAKCEKELTSFQLSSPVHY